MHRNIFQYVGEVLSKREAKKADGSVWGYELTVAQLGEKVSFIVTRETYNATEVGQLVDVRGRITQAGYNIRLNVDQVKAAEEKQAA